MKIQKFKSTQISGFLSTYEFAIISDRKTITQRRPTFFICLTFTKAIKCQILEI